MEVNKTNVERILAEKRHKELIGAIKTLASEFKLPEPDKSAADAINKHIKTIEGLVAKLKMPEIPAPIVNVETNTDGIISSISDIADRISSSLSVLKQTADLRPREWTFTVDRDFSGMIKSIIAKAN